MDVSLATSVNVAQDAAATAATAIDAASVSQQVTANNLANMNTPDFTPSRVVLGDLPEYAGVSVLGVYPDSPGPSLPVNAGTLPNGMAGPPYESAPSAPSGTDPAREMVQLMLNERTVDAAAAVVRAQEEMAGAVLDISA